MKVNNPIKFNSKKNSGDFFLAILVVFISILGIIMIFSASSYSSEIYFNDKFYFVKKQVVGFILGLAALIFFSFIDFNKYKKWRIVFLLIGIGLLAIVLIPGISMSSYGARRWISIAGFSFQPSEIAKFCFVFYCASVLTKDSDKHQTFRGVIKILGVGILYCVLIMLEPNMSVTMLVGFVMLMMLFIGGLKMNRFMMMALPVIAFAIGLILIEPYRMKRLSAFLDPWASPLAEGYQLIQSLYSFGNGGLFGVGLFQSRQKYLFLPFSESDFIFSIIGEELGLIGAGLILLVFAIIVYKGFKISLGCKNRFGCYLSAGITSVLAVQVLINIAVVTGSIPPTGLPLPFISSGSTSLVVFMAMIGVLINISKHQNKETYFFTF